jgi:hypothetical protein
MVVRTPPIIAMPKDVQHQSEQNSIVEMPVIAAPSPINHQQRALGESEACGGDEGICSSVSIWDADSTSWSVESQQLRLAALWKLKLYLSGITLSPIGDVVTISLSRVAQCRHHTWAL